MLGCAASWGATPGRRALSLRTSPRMRARASVLMPTRGSVRRNASVVGGFSGQAPQTRARASGCEAFRGYVLRKRVGGWAIFRSKPRMRLKTTLRTFIRGCAEKREHLADW
jgi:hypothetical protein